jgi:hypothetical protein
LGGIKVSRSRKGYDVSDAVVLMNRLIGEEGWEFPDAAHKAARELNVDQGELEEAYDKQFAR